MFIQHSVQLVSYKSYKDYEFLYKNILDKTGIGNSFGEKIFFSEIYYNFPSSASLQKCWDQISLAINRYAIILDST